MTQQPFRYLSVCSGIEAATVAWGPLGWQCAGLSEIEPFPRAVLQHRLGAVPVDWDHEYRADANIIPLFHNFTKIEKKNVGPINLLTGGTPCQSFSIAGKRLGLDDPRGNLSIEFLALAQRLGAEWLVWENVPGALSSWSGEPESGRDFDSGFRRQNASWTETGDFHAFLGLFRECGYSGCYRVLDAQYIRVDGYGRAVPQRRRRIILVGHLGNGARAFPVLFDLKSLRGDTAPIRKTGQDIAGTLEASLGRSRGAGQSTSALIGAMYDDGSDATVTSKWAKGSGGPAGDECYNLVAQILPSDTLDASKNRTDQGPPLTSVSVAPCLTAGGNATGGNRPYGMNQETAESLVIIPLNGTSITRTRDVSPTIAFPAQMSGTQYGTAFDHSPTLGASNNVAVAYKSIAFTTEQTPKASKELAFTLTKQSPTGGGQPQCVAFAQNTRDEVRLFNGDGQIVGSLTAEPGSHQQCFIAKSWAVRRLTPRECERLQGFPDDWTNIPWRKKEQATDSPRLKAIGNSQAVNMMRWVGTRLDRVQRIFADFEGER